MPRASITTRTKTARFQPKVRLMHHPDPLERVSLSPAVIRALQTEMIIGFGQHVGIGMLFGQIISGKQVNVHHLEPFFLTHEKSYAKNDSYVRGRWEAAVDMAWTLSGFMTVGYVLMYTGNVPSPEQMMADISYFRALKIELNEFILIMVTRNKTDSASVSAYTYTLRSPITGWRALSITPNQPLSEAHNSSRLQELMSGPFLED